MRRLRGRRPEAEFGDFRISLADGDALALDRRGITGLAPACDGIYLVGTAASADYPTIVPGDFNGDGNVDLVLADSATDMTAHLIRGNCDGTFQAPTQFSTAVTSSPVMDVADFNGDGLQDLIATDGQDVSVSMNRCL